MTYVKQRYKARARNELWMTRPTGQSDDFGNLLSKLVQVPKEEIDTEDAKWKAMRKRLKDKGKSKGVVTRKNPPPATE